MKVNMHCNNKFFLQKYQRKKLESMWLKLKNDPDRKKLEEVMMTLHPDVRDLITGDNKTEVAC